MASAETLPSKGKIRSHIAPVEFEGGHFRDTKSSSFDVVANKQPSLVSIRSTLARPEDLEYESRHRSTTLDYSGHGLINGSSGGGRGREHHRSAANRRHLEDYAFDDCRRRDRHHSHRLLVSASANPLDRVSVVVNESGAGHGAVDVDWANGAAHKRSHSEDRLKER